jgi:hypothetical protein
MIAGFARNAVLYNNKGDFSLSEQPDNQEISGLAANIIALNKK